jgi:hypothetical protein
MLAAFVVGLAGLTVTAGGASATVGPARAHLRKFVCQQALEPAQRLVSVVAGLRPIRGTRRLLLKFDLLAKPAGASTYTVVHGGDLGTWKSPPKQAITLGTRAGDVWSLNHPVADLPAPASYRFVVSFRWIGPRGRVLATVVRDSRTCFQPELRPNLEALSLVPQPIRNQPKRELYVGTIMNAGLTGAGPFAVEFTDGSVVRDVRIRHIYRHQTLTVRFVGPACNPTAPPTMTIDPTQQVDAYTRVDNSVTATCPASGSAPPQA